MAYTPGPWIARKGISYPAVVDNKELFEFIYIVEKENAMANARLISAAPELLNIAESLFAWAENGLIHPALLDTEVSPGVPLIEALNETLRKVRG